MRILIVVHGYPPEQQGGAERRAERTARSLTHRGHQVRVVCGIISTMTSDHLQYDDSEQDGVPVRRILFGQSGTRRPFDWSYDNPQVAEIIENLIGAWTPDVIHLFSGYLMSASVVRVALNQNIPIVVSLTDYWWLCHRINLLRSNGLRCAGPSTNDCARCQAETWRRYRLPAAVWPWAADTFWQATKTLPVFNQLELIRDQVERRHTLLRLLSGASALIAPSQYLADMYIRYGIDPTLVRVWRQGVDLNACLLRPVSSTVRFGYIGQMKPHKGVHLLLEAWNKLTTSRPRSLVLYGSAAGEERYLNHLDRLIAGHKDVTRKGVFAGADIWKILANLDVLVVPSRWVENSPNIILEAQAVGVPVVGSNLGGVAELIQHEHNGLLFEVDNADDLTMKLQRLLDEPDLLQRLRCAETPFRTVDEEVDQLVNLYEEVIVSRQKTGNRIRPPLHLQYEALQSASPEMTENGAF